MCFIFGNKKLKEQVKTLEEKVQKLESMFEVVYNYVDSGMNLLEEHLENDKDLDQGNDETTWNSY